MSKTHTWVIKHNSGTIVYNTEGGVKRVCRYKDQATAEKVRKRDFVHSDRYSSVKMLRAKVRVLEEEINP